MVRGQHSNGERMRAQSVPRHRIQLHAVAIDALINEMRRRRHLSGQTDRAVAVQVLVETGLERLQRGARSRHGSQKYSRGNCRYCRWTTPYTDRRLSSSRPPHTRSPSAPRQSAPSLAKLTGHNRRPAIAQLNRRPAIRIKKIVAPNLNQAGRSECLDHRRGRRCRRTDHAVAVQVLVETGLERLQRGARSRHGRQEHSRGNCRYCR